MDGLMSNQAGTDALLDALEKRIVQPGQLDATRRDQLLSHADKAFRERAAKVFSGATNSDRGKVIATYRESSHRGDAARAPESGARGQLRGAGHG